MSTPANRKSALRPNRGINILDFGADPTGVHDCSEAFDRALAEVEGCAHATLHIPDGDFGIARPLRVPTPVSIAMAPTARLFARPDFRGEAVVIKGEPPPPPEPGAPEDWGRHTWSGKIGGGMIDGGRLPVVGVIGRWTCRFELHDLEINNALAGGVRIGEEGWYETTVRGVRAQIDFDVTCLPDAVGVEVVKGSDNHLSQVLVIGYDIGVRGASGSTCFHQVHVWKGRHRPFKVAFHCGGWNDCYSQCHADECETVGFLVDAPFQRFDACMVQGQRKPGKTAGTAFKLTERGTHGVYVGTFINPSPDVPFEKVFDGPLEGSTIFGTLHNPGVPREQQVSHVASGEGGLSWLPVVGFSGEGLRLPAPAPKAPAPEEGQVGELRWTDAGGAAVLYLKTASGWRRFRMEE